MNTCERSAQDAGWFPWSPCGLWLGTTLWLHMLPWETATMERPAYIIGTARDLCLLQGLYTGEETL